MGDGLKRAAAAARATQGIPPTGKTLLALLAASGGALDYGDPRVTTSGLTALRHRGLARVEGKRVVMTGAEVGKEQS